MGDAPYIQNIVPDKASVPVYKKKRAPFGAGQIVPQHISGTWRRIKDIVLLIIFVGFYILPWIRWDRGEGLPNQAVLFRFPEARAYYFGLEFWPQDLFLLVLVLLSAAFGLFFTNTLVGRVWCGFTCPQTLWSDAFFKIERIFEGNRNKRMRRDAMPMSWDKAWRKIGKHIFWTALAMLTGLTFISYFTDARMLWQGLLNAELPFITAVFIFIFFALTYLLAGYAREKVCLYMCPWPRFQSAMLEPSTKLVTYQSWRGEPRGKAKKNHQHSTHYGDCIDCDLCVAVCPTGVDIRDGLQLGCIGCGLCIDACNSVMDKLHRSRELIGFFSDRDIAAAEHSKTQQSTHLLQGFLRPRTLVFGTLFGIAMALLTILIFTRAATTFDVTPQRMPAFITLSDGSIRNIYDMRLTERTQNDAILQLELEGLDGTLDIRNLQGATLLDPTTMRLDANQHQTLSFRVLLSVAPGQVNALRSKQQGSTLVPIRFVLRDENRDQPLITHETYFMVPPNNEPSN